MVGVDSDNESSLRTLVRPDRPFSRSDEKATKIYRFGYAGQRFQLEATQDLSARTVPGWPSTMAIRQQALINVVSRIGRTNHQPIELSD
jgi:hypothetical protein